MFTPIHTTLGALLLYQGASGLLLHNGRVFGISSLLAGCVFNPTLDNVPVIAGLVSSTLPLYLFAPSLIPVYPAAPASWAAAASTVTIGVLIGWGTKNGKGCTSGHMLCGISRLSVRSVIATAIFFTVALLTSNFAAGGTIIPACAGRIPCYYPVYPSESEALFMAVSVGLASIANFVVVPRVLSRSQNARIIFSYLAGLEFGLGLFISGMADPAKVLRFFAFLTDPSRFDPSLVLIMLFGLGPFLLTWLTMRSYFENAVDTDGESRKPTLAETWSLPTATVADIDWRFVAGAAAFGVGWGLSGACPGPALLRAVIQPAWGLLALSGYFLGNLF